MIENFRYNIDSITVMFTNDSERVCVAFGGNSYIEYSDLLTKISQKCNDWQTNEIYFSDTDELFDKDAKSIIFLISTLEYLGKHVHISTNKELNELLSLWISVENDPEEINTIVDHWSGPFPEVKTYKTIYARPSVIIYNQKGSSRYSKRYIKGENNEYSTEK